MTLRGLTKHFGPQIRAEVKARVAKIKENIIADATSHLISKREAKFMDEIEKQYNTEVEQHTAEVFKHKEADIIKEVARLEEQTKGALMEAANKVIHFQVTEETKHNKHILEAKEDSNQWKLILDIVARNKAKVIPTDTVAPTVLAPDSQPNLQESILSYLDPAPTDNEGNARQTATASLHNPANQMDTNLSAPPLPPSASTAPQDPLTAILAGITNLTMKMEGFETCLMAVEKGETPARHHQSRPAPPRPALKPGPKGILINSMPKAPPKIPPRPVPDITPPTAAPPPVTLAANLLTSEGQGNATEAMSEQFQHSHLSEEEWNALSPEEQKCKRYQDNKLRKKRVAEKARIDDPESFPPLPTADPNLFIVVTKQSVHNQQNMSSFAGAAHAAQAIPQQPAQATSATNAVNNLTTEVMIMRDGGLKDETTERAICSLNRSDHHESLHCYGTNGRETPPIPSRRRWAGSANISGNFVYVFNGNIKFAAVAPFGTTLITPLKRGLMVPAQGWVWMQLQNVPVSDENGVVCDSDRLTAEVQHNAVMARALLCTPVHWQHSPTAIMGDASAMALMPIVDEDRSLIRNIQANNIHMFGRQIKFVIVGNRPALIQCGRVHMLGHNTRSSLCKTPPHAVCCYKCGGPHHTQQHTFYCKGKHADARHCNCKLKCILCSNTGHHTRSQQCPKRGDFRPPMLVSPEERPTSSSEDDIEELTTTQCKGPKLTTAGLPRKKTQSQKGKGHKPATTNQFATLAECLVSQAGGMRLMT
ncbi:hypothetical protein V8E53_001369 [Lactarius tabidus]